MGHGIDAGKEPKNLEDKDLIFLWREMGRNRDVSRLFELEEGAKPENDFEHRYVVVYGELVRRELQ